MSKITMIFMSSLKVAFMSFGGGNAAAGLIEEEFVEKYKLASSNDFQNMLSLTNMFPGPVSINLVTLLSYRAAGWFGAFIAFCIMLFPGPILVVVFATLLHLYISQDILIKGTIGVCPVIVAMLLDFIVKSYRKHRPHVEYPLLYGICFVLTLVLLTNGINIAFVLLGAISILILIGVYLRRKTL